MSFTTEYCNHIRAQKREQYINLDTDQDHRAAAHNEAVTMVIEYIENHIPKQNEILPLSSLRLIYIDELEKQHFPNPDYRSEKLMSCHQKHEVSGLIVFSKVLEAERGCTSFGILCQYHSC